MHTPRLRILRFPQTLGYLHYGSSPALCPAAALLVACLYLSAAGRRTVAGAKATYPLQRSDERRDYSRRDANIADPRCVLRAMMRANLTQIATRRREEWALSMSRTSDAEKHWRETAPRAAVLSAGCPSTRVLGNHCGSIRTSCHC